MNAAARKLRPAKALPNVLDLTAFRRRKVCRQIVMDAFERAGVVPGVTAISLARELGIGILPRAGFESSTAPRGLLRPDPPLMAYLWRADRDHNPEVAGYLAQWLLRGRDEESDITWHAELTKQLLAECGPEVAS